jgi:hypothetical protein
MPSSASYGKYKAFHAVIGRLPKEAKKNHLRGNDGQAQQEMPM